jgi:hypothetical protein
MKLNKHKKKVGDKCITMLIRDKPTQDILLNSCLRLYNWSLKHLNKKKRRTTKTVIFFNELTF